MEKIVIIDYGMSNLGSIKRTLEECGAYPIISDNPKDLHSATSIILPGVGAYADGMKNLCDAGWDYAINEEVLGNHIPFLGICLGMQLIADKSFEGGENKGLGLISGEVIRLESNINERIPHIGWNEVYQQKESLLFRGIPNKADFYFVHSYHFKTDQDEYILSKTPYCNSFVSAIKKDNIIGVQFHPEKSQVYGLQLLKNFLNYCRNGGDLNC